jgi:hypothetical protein
MAALLQFARRSKLLSICTENLRFPQFRFAQHLRLLSRTFHDVQHPRTNPSDTMGAMKLSFRILLFILATVVFIVPRASAQNGSVQFTARITPSGGVDEPVRSFPFYLLRKSYSDIEREAAATFPRPDTDSFINALDASPELKKWMKRNQCVNLTGPDFFKKLKTDDILDVPEFFSAYVERMTGDTTVQFPTPKYKTEDKVKDPEKYARLKKQYYDSVRAFLVQNPKSTDSIDMALEEVNPGHKWESLRAQDGLELNRHTAELAQGTYLVARTETDVQGEGYLRGVPPGNYWLSSLNITATTGDARALWDVPVTVTAGRPTYVALSSINSVAISHPKP